MSLNLSKLTELNLDLTLQPGDHIIRSGRDLRPAGGRIKALNCWVKLNLDDTVLIYTKAY